MRLLGDWVIGWLGYRVIGVGALAAMFLAAGCQRSQSPNNPITSSPNHPITRFTEIAEQAGIAFTHVNGAYGRKLMPETVGSGLAFADFDGDGKPDLLIINGTNWPGQKPPTPGQGTCRLYKNLGGGKFADVTAGSGVEKPLYGMGVAIADYDGDGKEDIYLTAVGPNRLLHNEGNFHFKDVTDSAGVAGVPTEGVPMQWKWSASAAWLDYDKDGDLDLFVTQYVKWSPQLDPFCGHNGVRGYCPPDNFEGARCTLYRNDGDGKFTDISRAAGLFDGAVGKSFGIGIADFNGDGWPDLAVSNDTWANFLFVNEKGAKEGDRKFAEKGVEAGIAFAEGGKARAGMGIDVADLDNDGRNAIVIGNFADEGLSLFEQEGKEILFTDRAPTRGITAPSLLNVTFATFFLDADLDGRLDIFATNGHVDDIVNSYKSMLTFQQTPLLLHNKDGKTFDDISAAAGFTAKIVGRGAAYADIDGDGDLDIGVVDNGGRFRLYRNDTTGAGHFLRLKLVGAGKNTDALGSSVRITSKAGDNLQKQSRYLKSGGSFLSESERVLTFGLGAADRAESVVVTWPDGRTQDFGPLSADKLYTLRFTGEKSL